MWKLQNLQTDTKHCEIPVCTEKEEEMDLLCNKHMMETCYLHLAVFISYLGLQLLAFLQGLFTFYHEGYELAHEFEPYKQQLQFNLQNVSTHLVWVIQLLFHLSTYCSLLLDQKKVFLLVKIFIKPCGVYAWHI